MWFLGSAIAIIHAGFLNVAAIRVGSKDWVVNLLCLIANLIFVALFRVALLLLSQPQVFAGLALFLVAVVSCDESQAKDFLNHAADGIHTS